jgi:hypothetical protein
MGWMDPEIVLPQENILVICQSPDCLGLIKAYRSGNEWYDVHGNPIQVTLWKEEENSDPL